MWVFVSSGFVSIAQHKHKPKTLLVRARMHGDIEELFPDARVRQSMDTEYRFRAEVNREEVAKVIANQILEIDYGGLRGTIDDPDYHAACEIIGSTMRRVQDSLLHHDLELEALPFDLDEDEEEKE